MRMLRASPAVGDLRQELFSLQIVSFIEVK